MRILHSALMAAPLVSRTGPPLQKGGGQGATSKTASHGTESSKKSASGADDGYEGSTLRSIWVLFHSLFWIPVIGIPCLCFAFTIPFIGLTRAQRLVWRAACLYFRIVLWATGIAYTVVGLENLDPNGNYFFVCNHESIYDIPVAFAAFPFWLIAIAKTIISYFPIFGWAVALGGTIFIQRSNHSKALSSLEAGRKSLERRPRSVLLFPEGTRSSDGVVKPFKKGGLILAMQAGVPCVPVAICGTRRIIGRAVEKFEPIVACRVRVVIGKPVETKGMDFEQRDKLADMLQQEVVHMKAQWEKGVGSENDVRVPETFINCWRPTPPADQPFYGRPKSISAAAK